MENTIEVVCNLSQVDREYVEKILPPTKTKVVEADNSEAHFTLRLYTNCRNEEEAKSWITEFQKITKTTFSIQKTSNSTGRYVEFKRVLVCQHNTRSKKMYDISRKNCTKNTNCPSKMIITVHAIKRKFKGRDKETYLIRKDLPCEVFLNLSHNHNIKSADALRFRRVNSNVIDQLLHLFRNGHSPATALDTLKSEIFLYHDNPEITFADRSQCPDYMFCYHLYRKEFCQKYEPLTFNRESKDFLKKKIEEYNMEMNDSNSAEIVFFESDYVICICPPLLKRVHKFIKCSSDIVFMDSSGTIDHDGSRLFVLLTHSECGGLPLGIMITSSESCNIIKTGFQLLKKMVGKDIFGGRPDGPKIFLTDDSASEQAAISEIWKSSKRLLCSFHVLQSVWRWLAKSKNKIPTDQQRTYFEQFKLILYARTETECSEKYEIAKAYSERHDNYSNYLANYWNRKEMWALAFRNSLITKGNNTNNISEAVMRIIKDKIFNRVKAFNVVQLTDFILTKFIHYYEMRLLDAAHNRTRKNLFGKPIEIPPDGLLEKIQILTDNTALVPSESEEKLFYIVDTDGLICSCIQGNTGKLCKHIDWACLVLYSVNYTISIDNVNIRTIFYKIATGNEPPSNGLQPLFQENKINSACFTTTITTSTTATVITTTNNVQGEKMSEEQFISEGRNVITKLCTAFGKYLEKSPTDVFDALRKMLEGTEKLRTTAAFVSSCANFGISYHRRNRSRIPVQVTAISRRKYNFSGRNSQVGGRPRKNRRRQKSLN